MSKQTPAGQNCAKCGACSTVCPVYRQTGREYHTGRGKLHLLSKLDPAGAGDTYAEILSHCLLCGACSRVCSRRLQVAQQLATARSELTRRAGKQVMLRALGGGLLGRPRLLRALAPLARTLHHLRLPPDSGLNLRLGRPDLAETLPEPMPPAATSLPSPTGPYLFNGCYATYLEPQIGRSLNSLLVKQGITPAGPAPDWSCCGLAAYSSGQKEEARRLARRNIAAHPGEQPIIVACASCAAHLHRYPELLADDQQWRQAAINFAARVHEFSRFLDQRTSDFQPTDAQADFAPLRVYYHDPCHLRFELQITKEPRRLLVRHRQLELLPSPEGSRCCGHGGLFHLSHPATSAAILRDLCRRVDQDKPEVITTACSGCLLHWRQGGAEGQHQARVVHLAVLLDRLSEQTSTNPNEEKP